jgi:hypothetical protein
MECLPAGNDESILAQLTVKGRVPLTTHDSWNEFHSLTPVTLTGSDITLGTAKKLQLHCYNFHSKDELSSLKL